MEHHVGLRHMLDRQRDIAPAGQSEHERRHAHGPKKVYRLIRDGRFREVTMILRCEFDQDPEFLDDIIQGVYQRIVMAMLNQEKCGHGSDAKRCWMPAFRQAVEDATGLDVEQFLPSVDTKAKPK